VIERLVVDVIELRAVVDTRGRDGHPAPDELVKKRVALLAAIGDAGEGAVLPFDAQAGMPHHEHQEARLTLGEAVVGNRLNAFSRCQSKSSSMGPR
jgi:hypothetical protein